jgi:hypothetical protein
LETLLVCFWCQVSGGDYFGHHSGCDISLAEDAIFCNHMSRGTAHNVYNRARQRARDEAEFDHHDPVLERVRRATEAEAAERSKGRLDLCSVCRKFFRSNSPEVGICMCSSCRSKTTTTGAQDESDAAE